VTRKRPEAGVVAEVGARKVKVRVLLLVDGGRRAGWRVCWWQVVLE